MDRYSIFNKFNGRCAYCGCELSSIRDMQVDHVVPKFCNGTDNYDNMFPACCICNNFKRSFTVEEFRDQLLNQVAVLQRNSTVFRRLLKYDLVRLTQKNIVFYFEKKENTCY